MEEGSRLSLPYSTPELLYQMWILAEDFNTNNDDNICITLKDLFNEVCESLDEEELEELKNLGEL